MKNKSTKTSSPKRISDSVYFLSGISSVLEITDERSNLSSFTSSDKHPWAKWGQDNLLPDRIVQLVYDNNIKPELINTTANFIVGQGILLTKKVLKKGKLETILVSNSEIEDWFEENDIHDYLKSQATNFCFFANTFSEIVLTYERKAASIINIHGNDIRAEKHNKNTGKTENYYTNGDWSKAKYVAGKPKESNVEKIPSFNKLYPTLHSKFIFHGKEDMPGQPYYSVPTWLGTKAWTELANEIPRWHLAGIKNGYNIRWHIKIPRSYFDQYGKDAIKMERQVRDEMNQWLAGVKNVGKAFVSRYANDPDKEGWKIEALKYDLHDEAFSKLFEQSNQANAAGHGLHTTLAGIDTQGKLSSGSEMRLAYQIHIALKTFSPRKVLLKPLKIIQKLNGWDPTINFAIQDIDITTLDVNPTGTKNIIIQ